MSSAPARLRIVVLGYLIRGPVGGMAWHHLQYVLGLRALGHDVLFLEDSTDSEWCCYDPARGVVDSDPSYGLRFATEVFARAGAPETWAYWDQHRTTWHGPAAARAAEFCRTADLLLNLSGINPLREWTVRTPRRVFVDTDPVFTQIKHLTDGAARQAAAGHHAFFTFGENFGRAGCTIPEDGFPWQPTRQPVALDAWPVTPPPAIPEAAFSTVMLWDSYPERAHGGVSYGMKSKSFAAFRELPSRTTASLELALGGKDAPREELRAHGWRIAHPLEVALTPWDYQNYIQRSAGEFGVAKHGYVASRSGWFSERSAGYLASGRPIVVQDTGFTDWLRADAGVAAFTTPDEAVAALERVRRDLPAHARAARACAEEFFDARVVLRSLLERA